MWSRDDLRCVVVRYNDPPKLAVEVWRGKDTLESEPCANSEGVALQAHRLFDLYCGTPHR